MENRIKKNFQFDKIFTKMGKVERVKKKFKQKGYFRFYCLIKNHFPLDLREPLVFI
jgi:hypothetical protein